MRETVGRNSLIECFPVPPESSWQLLRWVHFELGDADFASLLADVAPRLAANPGLCPLEAVVGRSRVAAAYFVRLDGNVATLGGLRAKIGFERQAGRLLDEFQQRLNAADISQIQALVDVKNLSSTMVMLNSTFRKATTVSHLWFDLLASGVSWAAPFIAGSAADAEYSVRPACQFEFQQVAALVEATFIGTLDCPDLDGLRTAAEVVGGFLESRAWDESLPWAILCHGSTPVGCSFVNPHPQGIFELTYVGLIPAVRGRRLGRSLVEGAIRDCRQRGGHFLTTAVDMQNWPASEIYRSLGFTEIRELGVWLPKVAKSQQVAAA